MKIDHTEWGGFSIKEMPLKRDRPIDGLDYIGNKYIKAIVILRYSGMSYRDIGEIVNRDFAYCHRIFRRWGEIKKIKKVNRRAYGEGRDEKIW